MRIPAVAVALITAPALALATGSSSSCALTDQQFSERVDALGSWHDIHAHQQANFPPCRDDGMYAQAHTELVVRTLVASWNKLPELAVLAQSHPDFKSFVFRHVNAKAGRVDLQTVMTYATIRCPRGHAGLCDELRRSAALALQALQ